MHLNFSPTELYEPWLSLQQPQVRQLAFCIGSPNILRKIPSDLTLIHTFQFHNDAVWTSHLKNYWPRLQYLDQHPEELLNFLQKLKSTRLGLRFEMFIWFWLLEREYHHYELLGHSIQKINGPKTVGELDFILRNTQTGEVEHWEVALKYYLAERDFSLPYWYGLNRSDTLNRKLTHFTQKQFQFEDALNHPIQRRFCILKGQLYLPEVSLDATLPDWVNPSRRLGQWGHQIPSNTQHYYRLQRHEWIFPLMSASSLSAEWWTDGLYKEMTREHYYMFRQPSLLTTPRGQKK